ncbi:hypothetical protein BKA58DRAFT_180225 [Alternaria rosae]|uniref:uncharacterized protein n=1 Tax=Alternaria rosae TaxID=1187941 RepID=UPI001E8DA1B7|nr:uncharacterized protein BKA58DRAFT_180225 [Alternaria rosae]KAH6870638.1 hypothetical protein BKA58DRAFT_180225 [Alternaria rosae]
MGRHAEEELRESYYIHCRNRGYTIDEASERSLTYVRRVLNADSLTSKRYLEELYQASVAHHIYSSSPSSYDDESPKYSSLKARDKGIHDAFNGFSGMMESLFDDNDKTFAEMRTQEEDWSIPSVPGYRAPQYIPSHYDYRDNSREPQRQHAEDWSTPSYRRPDYIPSAYDYQSNARQSRENSDRYTTRDYDPQRSSSYGPRSHPYSWSHSSNKDREPPSGYRYWSAESSRSSHSSSTPSYTFYSSSDSYPTNSSYSFRPSAPPKTSYVTPPPSSSQQPAMPPPQGIKPNTDFYIMLGLSRSATAADIKKAHRAMSLKWHPDRCRGQDKRKATERMAEINQANDVLSDEVKRKFYDTWRLLPSEV